jgi:hypothetical protein
MPDKVKVRGIYSTSLTYWLMEEGYYVVEPSAEIMRRMSVREAPPPEDLLIRDRRDRQGVHISGTAEKLTSLVSRIQQRFEDAVLLELVPVEEHEGLLLATLEFPGRTKEVLDSIRAKVVPTLVRHHLYRIIDSQRLDQAETALSMEPQKREQIGESLFWELVMAPLERMGTAQIQHVRISGRPVRPRRGVLEEIHPSGFTLKRSLMPGVYDGLQCPIEKGDFAITRVTEGKWVIKHSYFNQNGDPKGEYFNINTPVELYPWGARYVDLEVDVVRRPGEAPRITDRERLVILHQEGFISSSLMQRAVSMAEHVIKVLNEGGDPMEI